MTYDTRSRPPLGAPILSPADLAEAVRELESLRNAHRADLAERLRHARAFGRASDDDDHLAVLEEAAVAQSRIAQLERLVASATVIEAATDDVAGLGSHVRVRDEAGRETEYELVGRRGNSAGPEQVTAASPVGEALLGARGGDRVQVVLPSGKERTLTVLAVRVDDPPLA